MPTEWRTEGKQLIYKAVENALVDGGAGDRGAGRKEKFRALDACGG